MKGEGCPSFKGCVIAMVVKANYSIVVERTCCNCNSTSTATSAATTAIQPIGEQPVVCHCSRGNGHRRIPSVNRHNHRRRCRHRRRRGCNRHRLKSVQCSAGDGGRGRSRRRRCRWRWQRPVTVQSPPAPVPQGLALASAVAANILFHSPRNFAVSRPRWQPWPASAAYGDAADHRAPTSRISDWPRELSSDEQQLCMY